MPKQRENGVGSAGHMIKERLMAYPGAWAVDGPGCGRVDHGSLMDLPDRSVTNVEAEDRRLHAAIQAVRTRRRRSEQHWPGTWVMRSSVFRCLRDVAESPELLDAASTEIKRGNWAAGSVARVVEKLAKQFDAIPDAYLRERAADIRALGGRIIDYLLDQTDTNATSDRPIILVGQCPSVLDIGKVEQGNLAGIVTADGSALSHAAIVARAPGIPAVVGVQGPPFAYLDGHELVVDGYAGKCMRV